MLFRSDVDSLENRVFERNVCLRVCAACGVSRLGGKRVICGIEPPFKYCHVRLPISAKNVILMLIRSKIVFLTEMCVCGCVRLAVYHVWAGNV